MNKIPRIHWDQIYSVHVDRLDDQHKKLFDIANQLIDVFEAGSGDFLSVINDLVDYITIHFRDERVVMMNANFSGLSVHTREHDKFIAKVEEFLKDYDESNENLGFKMVVFLKDWINEHTTKVDMEYAKHLLKCSAKTSQG